MTDGAPVCRSCFSEVRVSELRAGIARDPRKIGAHGPFRRIRESYPLGAVSWCPVHGLGWS